MLSRLVTGQVEKILISYSLTVFVKAFQVLKIVFEQFDSVAVYKISDFPIVYSLRQHFVMMAGGHTEASYNLLYGKISKILCSGTYS